MKGLVSIILITLSVAMIAASFFVFKADSVEKKYDFFASSSLTEYYLNPSSYEYTLKKTPIVALEIKKGDNVVSLPLFKYNDQTITTMFREWSVLNEDGEGTKILVPPGVDKCKYLLIRVNSKLADRFTKISDFIDDVNTVTKQQNTVADTVFCTIN
jgi:hypothetical protein